MSSILETYLADRYLNLNHDNISDLMDLSYTEAQSGKLLKTFIDYAQAFKDESLLKNGVSSANDNLLQYNEINNPTVNHATFTQNLVNEYKTGSFEKSAQILIQSLHTRSNPNSIDGEVINDLISLFKTTQGLVELPISIVLKIGALYDSYYYKEPDQPINLKTINGLTGINGSDILDNDDVSLRHYGSYAYNDLGLSASTIPFIRPLTPKSIEDKMVNGPDRYQTTNKPKNHRSEFYNYDSSRMDSVSNNISSHIPVSGYGVLNNYLNTMSYILFDEGLDGSPKESIERNNPNTDNIPYHIIGNYNGRLKTMKTYNDQNVNFMTSYVSHAPNFNFDLSNLSESFGNLTSSIKLDEDFLFTDKESTKKIEFFLMLSKIKVNYLSGKTSQTEVYDLLKILCEVNNLNAKETAINTEESYDLPDFVALLLYSIYPPDGPEPSEGFNRPNKGYRVLSKYLVDESSFIGISTETPSINNLGLSLQKQIIDLSGDYTDISRIVTTFLIDMWSMESDRLKSRKLSKVDGKGVFVLYPGAGGGLEVNNLFTASDTETKLNDSTTKDDYEYKKTNVVSTIISDNDKSLSTYIKGLNYEDSNFIEYEPTILNDMLLYGNTREFYQRYENIDTEINRPRIPSETINKFTKKRTIPANINTNDKAFLVDLNPYDPVYYEPKVSFSNPTTVKKINYLDRYDDVHIIANTTDPDAIHRLKFDNRTLILNSSRLLWFDQPTYTGRLTPTHNKYLIKGNEINGGGSYITLADTIETTNYIYDIDIYGDEFKNRFTENGFYNNEGYDLTFKNFPKGKGLYLPRSYNFQNDPDANNLIKFSDKSEYHETSSIKSMIDIFDIDKLEDFRTLYKQFSNNKTSEYFTKTFNSFNFKSLLKHLCIIGHENLPSILTLHGRTYNKNEISALLYGYTGHFIQFASTTGLSRLLNTSLTIAQESKASVVIDEFLNDKITVNNYSTMGPLNVENTTGNPTHIKINSFAFNPIIAYSSEEKTYSSIVGVVGDQLLFRTILFGDQNIQPYNPDIQDPLVIEYLIDKYVYLDLDYSKFINPSLGTKHVITQLTKNFFTLLNIELNEGNLKLLVSYLRDYIEYTIPSSEDRNGYSVLNGSKEVTQKLMASFRGNEGDQDTDIQYDISGSERLVLGEIVNGVYETVSTKNYLINAVSDLDMGGKFDEWVKTFNEKTVNNTIKLFDSSMNHLYDRLINIEQFVGPRENAYSDFKSGDEDVKAGTYYRIKTLYDKNVSFKNIDLKNTNLIKEWSSELANIDVNEILNQPLFYNFNVQSSDFCDEDSFGKYYEDRDIKTKRLKDLFDYTSILDRGNNDYGSKVLVDINGLSAILGTNINSSMDVKKSTDKSMWSVLSMLASEHEFLLLPLTSYINLNGTNKNDESPYDLAHDMFGVFRDLEMWDSNPSFVFQLGSLTSEISRKGQKKKGMKQTFDPSNTFCLDIDPNQLDVDGNGRLLNEDVPSDISNSNITSFIVDFANQNQNMFKNIQVSTDEFVNTEESIKTTVSLSDKSSGVVLSSGKLFSAMESRSYSCTVTSLGNATIQPLSYFYLRNVPLFYGTYWITNVSHKITPNSMITTFKGVRQPIARKPNANNVVIKKLINSAFRSSQATGFTNRSDITPLPTKGIIYSDRGA